MLLYCAIQRDADGDEIKIPYGAQNGSIAERMEKFSETADSETAREQQQKPDSGAKRF